jgi:hypothetical protein
VNGFGWAVIGAIAGAVAVRVFDIHKLIRDTVLLEDFSDVEDDELEAHFANWRKELDKEED